MKSKIALVLMVFTMIAAGCKKSDPSKSSLLTQSPWKMTSFKVNGTESILACQKDDVWTFKSDGSLTSTVGADNCSGAQTNITGTWSINGDDYTYNYGSGTFIAVINQLDDHALKHTYTLTLGSVTTTAVYTFAR